MAGNLIGTTGSGAGPLGNAQDGVFLAAGAIDNLIGGTAPAAGNLISANQSNGVELFSAATGNQVLGNRIGTDAHRHVLPGQQQCRRDDQQRVGERDRRPDEPRPAVGPAT